MSIFAGSLGRAIRVWYGFGLALLTLESFLPLIWAGSTIFSIAVLVPINNRGFLERTGPSTALEGRA